MLWFSPCWVCKYQVLSTQAGNTLAIAGSCSLSWVSPPKKKTKPHRSSGSRHTRRTDTRAAQRSTSTSTSTPLSLSLLSGLGLVGSLLPFFPFPCLLWLFGRILFFSFLHHPILPSAKPSTLLLTYLLSYSVARSFHRSILFRFASLSCVSSSFHQHPSPT